MVGQDLGGVNDALRAVGPREAKVSELQVPVVVDQQVGGLQVAVQDGPHVAVVQALQRLQDKGLHEGRRHRLAEALVQARKVVLHVLEHEVDGPLEVVARVDCTSDGQSECPTRTAGCACRTAPGQRATMAEGPSLVGASARVVRQTSVLRRS